MKHLITALVVSLAAPTALADASAGQKLHDENCLKCHGTEVYTREDRFVGNRDALTTQVNRCNVNLGTQWFDEDVENVVNYLDQSFYKFK